MVYLFTIMLSATFIYFSLCFGHDRKFLFIALMPYFLVAALQYGVGTDYFNYIEIYNTGVDLERFALANEYVFYYIFIFLQEYNIDHQWIFIFSSLINTSLFYFILVSLKRMNFNILIVFLLFMLVTGIYQNQLNGLRNYAAILSFVLCFCLLVEKKYLAFIIVFIFGFFCHLSFTITIPIYILVYLKVSFKKRLIEVFWFSIPFYFLILPTFIDVIVQYIFPKYVYLLNGEVSEAKSFASLVPKLVLFPFYLYAVYLYSKDYNKFVGHKNDIMHYGMNMFVVTYFMFLILPSFGIFTRVLQYFSFFYIFPLYYFIDKFNLFSFRLSSYRFLLFVLFMIFVIFPYVAKVTFFKANEYDYISILSQGII